MNSDNAKLVLVKRIISALELDEKEFEKRKAYLQIEQADIDALKEIEPHLRDIHTEVMEEFYQHLLGFETTAAFLKDNQTVKILKDRQARYFEDLTRGIYDWEYVQNRLAVGIAHQQIGLEPRWYIGAYAKFINSLIPKICHYIDNDVERASKIIQALLKIVFLDINIVLDTYMTTDQFSIRNLKDYAENLFNSIPIGLIVVSRDMNILSCNEYMQRYFNDDITTWSGYNLYKLFPDSGLNDRAIEVLRSRRPQVGIRIDLKLREHSMPCQVSLSPLEDTSSDVSPSSPGVLLVLENISENALMIRSTSDSDDHVRAIMDNIADGIISIDQNGIIESYNRQAEVLFGYSASEVIGNNVSMLMPEPDASHHDNYLEHFLKSGQKVCLGNGFRQVMGKHRNGSTFYMDLSISQMRIGNRLLFIGIVRDVSDRVKAEQKMTQLSSALEQAADSVIITNSHGLIEYVNAGFELTTGYKRDEVIGKTPSILKSGMQDSDFYQLLWKNIKQGCIFRDVIINRKKDGSLYYEEKTITPLKDLTGNITHYISTGKDITERMHTQQRMQFMANHDALTLLPNRVLFLDRLGSVLSTIKRNNSYAVLLFLDLDRFKNINDSLGHELGDRLLQQVAKRLSACLRDGDTVARFSGDEFAILLSDVSDQNDITTALHKIIEILDDTFNIDGHELYVSASIGITVAPDDGTDPITLLKNADIAMYRAKSEGKPFSFFTPDMHARAEERLRLENDLHRALQKDQLYLVYQPQFDMSDDRRIIGIEALLRWQHPEYGVMSPAVFIPLMEEIGIINQVGNWIVDKACQQLKSWLESGLSIPHISINVSPHQLGNPEFPHSLSRILNKYDLQPGQLELEITESSLLENEERACQILNEIHQAGINIAMDDFGTGYSSLSYLRKLPINTLKIDRSFVNDVPFDKDDSKLANTIIAMGQSLSLTVIAEGVENHSQLDFLKQSGCNAVQGYLTGKPLPADEIFPT